MAPEKDPSVHDDEHLDDDSFVTKEDMHGPSDDDFCGHGDVHDIDDMDDDD